MLNNTVINPTKIIDSYSVETGGRSNIVIRIIIPDKWYKKPIIININGNRLNILFSIWNIDNMQILTKVDI